MFLVHSPAQVAQFTKWADHILSLHTRPCEFHPGGEHKWTWRIGLLSGKSYQGCDCGAALPDEPQARRSIEEERSDDERHLHVTPVT